MTSSIVRLCATTAILLAMFLSASQAVMAEGLTVRPIRVDLNDDQQNDSIMVTNGEETAQLLRVDAVSWDQSTGDDVYTPDADADLFLVPAVLNAQAGETRVIRLGLRHAFAGTRERAFRVFVTEIPSMLDPASSVTFAFRIAIPVFVTAGTPVAAKPEWKAQLNGLERIRLTASNPGDLHVRIDTVSIYSDASKKRLLTQDEKREYLLGHAVRPFDFDVTEPLVAPTVVVDGTDAEDVPFSVLVPVVIGAPVVPAISPVPVVPVVSPAAARSESATR